MSFRTTDDPDVCLALAGAVGPQRTVSPCQSHHVREICSRVLLPAAVLSCTMVGTGDAMDAANQLRYAAYSRLQAAAVAFGESCSLPIPEIVAIGGAATAHAPLLAVLTAQASASPAAPLPYVQASLTASHPCWRHFWDLSSTMQRPRWVLAGTGTVAAAAAPGSPICANSCAQPPPSPPARIVQAADRADGIRSRRNRAAVPATR